MANGIGIYVPLENDNRLFDTNDGTSNLIGQALANDMGLIAGQSQIYYYKTYNYADDYAPIVCLVRKWNTTFAARLPEEAERPPLPADVQQRVRQDFAANFLAPLGVDDRGRPKFSDAAAKLIDALVNQPLIRHRFYLDRERAELLKQSAVAGAEAELLLKVDADRAAQFFAEVDLALADDRHRDNGNYVLFEADKEFGLPDPAWIAAARPYLAQFRANFGHYTTDARIYERVLVVAHPPLSDAIQRAARYLNYQGVEAQTLAAADAGDLEAKLKGLINSGYPLPTRRDPPVRVTTQTQK